MAIAFVNAGTGAAGTTSVSVPFPTTTVAGNLLILAICNKYPANAPTTPSGWTLRKQTSGGAGASGADTGSVFTSVYTKIADGTEGGTNLSVTITSGNAAIANIFQYSAGVQSTWAVTACGGAYSATAGVSWSATGDADLGILTSDVVLAFSGVNTDLYTYSAEALASTGVTFGTMTERGDAVTTSGDDCGLVVAEFPVQEARSSTAPVYTMTASGTAASNPAGSTVCLRIRELLYQATNFGGGASPSAAEANPARIIAIPTVQQIQPPIFQFKRGKTSKGRGGRLTDQ